MSLLSMLLALDLLQAPAWIEYPGSAKTMGGVVDLIYRDGFEHFEVSLTISTNNGTVRCSTGGGSPGACASTYLFGTVVALTGTPDANYIAGTWGGDCSGTTSSPCTITMDAAKSVTATFTAIPLQLDITKGGTGAGTVTSSPAGINCGATCSASFGYGSSIMLTATPATGSNVAWSGGGGCSGSSAGPISCTVVLTAVTTVSVTFGVISYPLTVAHAGAGAGTTRANVGLLSCPGMCSDTYGYNTNVVLTATPANGSVFGGFVGGGCSGLSITCTVNIVAATTVRANYNVPVSVTARVVGTGTIQSSPTGITCPGRCVGVFQSGTSLRLTATPDEGASFRFWSGACAGQGSVCTITVPTTNTSATATFI